MKSVFKAVLVIIGLIVCAAFLELAVEIFYPAGIQTKSVQRAHAFLFNGTEFHDLPDKVEITIDGIRSVFHKGTQPYNDLMHHLHDGRSEDLFERAGPPPPFPGTRSSCGEMIVSSYRLPSYFRIIRSDKNQNYYWIGLPKLTSPGTSWPIFTVDTQVIDILHGHHAERCTQRLSGRVVEEHSP